MNASPNRAQTLFDLTGRVAVITGGAGLLGYYHGAILAAAGASVVLLDLAVASPAMRAEQLQLAHGTECLGLAMDITHEASIVEACEAVLAKFGRVDILINNAANNPKVEDQKPGQPVVAAGKLSAGDVERGYRGWANGGVPLFAGVWHGDGGGGKWRHRKCGERSGGNCAGPAAVSAGGAGGG